MHLKKLESVGFKSFAEKISVDFVPGVTAVVGPNGSGKSNVTDAIRWVLGEQSAKSLRGTKMEDIIFQGSDTRKPLNMAEVTLTLDNRTGTLPLDYAEVSVTRRVYRSGESDFYINKESCRLKDIVDLFMDSGLGREAFSIISQGKVEEILSSKAEERRSIFEEAAGVLKYKTRKKKAEYKLIETEDNLNRVEDILFEIDKQLDPLNQQATIAKEYLEKKDKLELTELKVLRTEIEDMYETFKGLTKDLASITDTHRQQVISLSKEEEDIDQIQLDIRINDEKVNGLQEQLLNLTETIEKKTGEKNVYLERERYASENKDKLLEQRTKLNSDIETLQNELDSEERSLSNLKNKLKNLKLNLIEVKDKANRTTSEIEDAIEDEKSGYIDSLNKEATHKHEKQSLNQAIIKLSQEQEKVELQIKERELKISELQSEYAELDKQYIDRKSRYEKLEQINQDKKQYVGEQTEKLSDMLNKREQAERQMDKIKSRIEFIEEMKESYQGYFQGVKVVLKARGSDLEGIRGALIDLVQIPKNYVDAMEIALGNQSQNIVTENESHARAAINYLKKRNAGRATFYPLSAMKARRIPSSLLSKVENHPGYVNVASDVIKSDSSYRELIDYLLGSTIITKTLKDANEIAQLLNRKFRIVTLEGDLVNPGGSMSGGAKKRQQSSLFNREQELTELKDKLVAFEERTAKYVNEIDIQKAKLRADEASLKDVVTDEKVLSEEMQNLRENLNEKRLLINHQGDQLAFEKQKSDQLSNDLAQRNRALIDNEEQLTLVRKAIEESKKRMHQLEEEKQHFNEHRETNLKHLQQLEVEHAELNQQQIYQSEKVSQLINRKTQLLKEQESNDQALFDLDALEKSVANLSELSNQIEVLKGEKGNVIGSIQEHRQKRLQLDSLISSKEETFKQHQNQLTAVKEQMTAIEVKKNRIDVDLTNRLTYLQENYEMSYERLKENVEVVENIDELKKVVKLLKKDIEELGVVNLGAIDEFDRVNERHTFLIEQQRDLIEAKTTLYEVIDEMDTVMKQRFSETFASIKTAFSDVFKQLFGGGHAMLSLSDPTDILTTGVDIKAQPPGKKAQQLALLSGGERALTAIALLFSILKVRPVPFCVLDEVEAALDEANVERFSRYLKDYSEETQFIVITHRKGTMEGADVLYGVTMQESGVSRFVSVKLEETKAILETK